MTLEIKGKTIELLEDGFMSNRDEWTKDVAEALAQKEDISLTDQHWMVIDFLRKYFKEYLISPNIKTLIKLLQKEYGEDSMNNKLLYKIFPKGPAFQGCKIAGLPKPTNCIDG